MAATGAPLLLRLVAASVSAANRAGVIIREVMRKGNLGIIDKGINDLQTEADRSAQRCIIASFSKHFPNVAVIGEEENLEPGESPQEESIDSFDESVLRVKCPPGLAAVKAEDIVVWVDPLDGTSEYTQGFLDHVTVLIGVAVDGKAVAGVIHQPFYNYQVEKDLTRWGRTIWGIDGVGAFGISREQPPAGQRIVTTTRSHGNKVINAAIEAIKPTEVVKVGGAGHKVLLVIEGKAHAYVFASKGCKKWDTCAPEAVLSSIGGKLTDIFGQDILYHKNVEFINGTGVLATCDATNQWYSQQMPDDVKIALLPSSSM